MEIQIFEKDGQLVTTSNNIAEVFGKEHKDVLKAIRNIIQSWNEIDVRNFAQITYFVEDQYTDEKGRNYPMYYLTKKGTARLVMGFTGISAERFKIGYIERFDQMD